jgi:DNA replication protein DnaC
MAAVLNAMRESHHVIFARSDDVLSAAKDTWGTQETQSDALARYQYAEILFLDDMHIDTNLKLSSHYREIMTSLIRHRYDHNMPTMITCNMEKSEFYEDWGKRLADAVMDMCHWIPIGGEKLRDTDQDWSAI